MQKACLHNCDPKTAQRHHLRRTIPLDLRRRKDHVVGGHGLLSRVYTNINALFAMQRLDNLPYSWKWFSEPIILARCKYVEWHIWNLRTK